jgi:hypothetical protein
VVDQPLAGSDAGVAGEVVGDDRDLPGRVGLLHQRKEPLQLALLRDGAVIVTSCPSATRNPPYTQVFSKPRPYSSGALTRCPSVDQPGSGGKLRGMTGPSSSAQTTVIPAGGWV